MKYSHNKKSGLIDFKGKQVIPARYTMITSTGQKDLFLVSKNNKQGVYDILLKREIIPVEYDKVKVPDYHKYFKLVRDGKMGMCNSEHKIIVPIKHDQVYKQGKFILVKNNGKQGYYSTEGSLIIPIKYDQGDYDGQKKAFFMSKGDKLWIYKPEGKLIETIKKPVGWKPREMIEVISGSTDDNVEVNLVFEIPSAEPLKPHKKGEKWGFNRGKKNIIPYKYDVVWSFYDGFARVKYKGKFGYINEKGVEYFED